MRKFLPVIRFALPWFIAALVCGAGIVWLIIDCNLGKTAALLLVLGYMIAGFIAAWIVAPLAPPASK